MQRIAVVVIVGLAACAGHGVRTEPLPEAAPTSLATLTPQLVPGERITWDVFWQGMEIGRAQLGVDAREARTTFHTGALASALANVRYDLRSAAGHATEVLTHGGSTERTEVTIEEAGYRVDGAPERAAPGGGRVLTMTTALGVVRTWSRGAAPPPAFVWLVHRGELYRLDVFSPVGADWQGHAALRVDAMVRAFDRSTSVELSVWLAATPDRTPVRFVVRAGGERVSAELVDATVPSS